MRKLAAGLVCLAFASSTALGGIVTFIRVRDVDPGGTEQFDVYVSTTVLDSFDFVEVLAASNDLQILSLDYAQSWVDANVFALDPAVHTGIFPNDLLFGGFLTAPASGPTLIGTLTVGTEGLGLGEYELFVDSSRDFDQSLIGLLRLTGPPSTETLSGSALVNVVPEPMTLSLLGLGALALLRRRPYLGVPASLVSGSATSA